MKAQIFLMSAVAAMILSSCGSTEKIQYFQDVKGGSETIVSTSGKITMKPDDKIVIIVNSRDYQLTNLFNLPYVAQRLGSSSEQSLAYSQGVCGYTVDATGCIDFPVLGRLYIKGMTRSQVEEYVKEQLIDNDLVKDPVVTCDYMNLHVSVMGEVTKPGRYNIDHDSYTILDAISAAGDLAIYAERHNVKVLRVENGVKKTYEVNLCSAKSLMSSPAYYLQQNDIVYVSPNKMRMRQSTVNGNNVLTTSFWLSLVSLAATLVTTVSVIVK